MESKEAAQERQKCWDKASPGPLFRSTRARPDVAHALSGPVGPVSPVGPVVVPNRCNSGGVDAAPASRGWPQDMLLQWLAIFDRFGCLSAAVRGHESAFLAPNIERAGEKKVWSRLAPWDGSWIGNPIDGELRPRQDPDFFHPLPQCQPRYADDMALSSVSRW